MDVISLCTEQANYPSSYSNLPNLSIFLVLQLLNRVRAAAKISTGGVGSPYN